MAEATSINRGTADVRLTLAAAVVPGEVYQLYDGRAAVYPSFDGAASGTADVKFKADGQYTVLKRTGEVWVKGDPLWWDRSASVATSLEPVGNSDRDFFIGVATADAASADASGSVNLNVCPFWVIDSARDNGKTVIVGAAPPVVYNRGGMLYTALTATVEAQKTDWLSDRGFAPSANWVADILLEVVTAPSSSAVDIDVGIASGTHASDFETVAEFAAFHLDGGDTNIDAHSDDNGALDIAPTDTTTDWTAGTPVRLKLDGRDQSNVKYYVEGAEVLAATANLGNLAAAVGPLFAIIHAEKTADASGLAMKARIRVRTMEQD